MAQNFVDWLVDLAVEGDASVLDRLAGYMDQHLAGYAGDKAEERHRVASEFSQKAPPTALGKDMLAIIQP
jgi:hypothetical protein